MSAGKLTEAQTPQICPVCGGTDPWPRWICLYRLNGVAVPGKPCSYSRESHEKFEDKLRSRITDAGRKALAEGGSEP